MNAAFTLRTLILLLSLSGATSCATRLSITAIQKVSNWSALSPLDMLREAGRICCDANTFDAVGTHTGHPKTLSTEPLRLRCVFGPDGEYRYEYGAAKSVFDTRDLCVTDGTGHCHVYPIRKLREAEGHARWGPHNRYPGDAVMAAGGGLIYFVAAGRLLGSDWPEACLPIKDSRAVFQQDEAVSNHPCRKILLNIENGPMTIWIDHELGVIRKLELGEGENRMSAQFDRITLNPKLDSTAFAVPRECLE